MTETTIISTSHNFEEGLRFKKKFKAAFDTKAYEKIKTIVLNNITKKSFIIFAEENPAALPRSHDSTSMTFQSLFSKILYAKQ
jgi:hypothetical protein